MTLLLGTIGWGLLAVGAVTHIWHQERLRELLAMHFDHETPPAIALITAETVAAVGLPVAFLVDWLPLAPFVALSVLLGAVFCAWITQLLATGSSLPCACSFSAGPTSPWALARAATIFTTAAFLFAAPGEMAISAVTFAVGAAVAVGIFVLPESLSWPLASRALLARSRAHSSAPGRQP